MRKWMVPVVTLSSLALLAACGETSTQRTGTGAAGGALAGAVVGGPVGAVVGGGVGAVAGANRDKIDQGTDKAADATREKVAETADKIEGERQPTSARSADRTAGPALSNAEVKDAQTVLKNIGLYDGSIDGIYGPRTREAVGDFQAQNDLPKSGRLDAPTREKLHQQASAGSSTSPSGTAPSRAAPSSDTMPGGQPAQPQQSQ